mmetsp:Transcript_16170/g.48036  ORF Transcript_16170/g.48036 Transcript_16170/m.48036 type:complete len:209 (+) Transcript_16170:526-1152(+)
MSGPSPAWCWFAADIHWRGYAPVYYNVRTLSHVHASMSAVVTPCICPWLPLAPMGTQARCCSRVWAHRATISMQPVMRVHNAAAVRPLLLLLLLSRCTAVTMQPEASSCLALALAMHAVFSIDMLNWYVATPCDVGIAPSTYVPPTTPTTRSTVARRGALLTRHVCILFVSHELFLQLPGKSFVCLQLTGWCASASHSGWRCISGPAI